MYIPKHYLATDREEIMSFMNTFSFATIVTSRNNHPTATHLPFVVSKSEGRIVLTSHFARANPQWKEIADQEVLVIFSGPHAYISPKYYESKINVPTWNYVAVHVYGKARIITGQEASFEVLDSMISSFEKEYAAQWNNLPMDYKLKMLKGIVAFEILVTDIQAKKKLSQNKKAVERQRIIDAFENSGDPRENALSAIMKKDLI